MRTKFVHIDLDLYEPILGALNYFYPKMVLGGIIVCDDYGSLYWPGAQMAVEQFAEKNNLNFISLN
jgi:O-methyltransferase